MRCTAKPRFSLNGISGDGPGRGGVWGGGDRPGPPARDLPRRANPETPQAFHTFSTDPVTNITCHAPVTRAYEWPNSHLYRYGRKYRPNEHIERLVGELSTQPSVTYLRKKSGEIYRLSLQGRPGISSNSSAAMEKVTLSWRS